MSPVPKGNTSPPERLFKSRWTVKSTRPAHRPPSLLVVSSATRLQSRTSAGIIRHASTTNTLSNAFSPATTQSSNAKLLKIGSRRQLSSLLLTDLPLPRMSLTRETLKPGQVVRSSLLSRPSSHISTPVDMHYFQDVHLRTLHSSDSARLKH